MKYVVLFIALFVLCQQPSRTSAKILPQCDAVKELKKAHISRSLMSNWVCLMESASGLDTNLVTGPKAGSSFSFGIFQIPSGTYCTRGRSEGICQKKCEDLAKDDIQDAITCAKKIQATEGFKFWDSWEKKCKNKPLPNLSHCD